MALKIRCQECRKRISIDEAFAGGVCRCPYCKALTVVPGGAESATPTVRPDRPEAPTVVAGEAPAPAHEHVPVARPVLIQGVVAIIGAGMLVLFVALAIFMAVLVARKMSKDGGTTTWEEAVKIQEREQEQGHGDKNPFKTPGMRVLGEPLESPVAFVLDASASMRNSFDLCQAILRRSVLSFNPGDLFNVLVAREDGIVKMQASLSPGMEGGERRAGEFLRDIAPDGEADIGPAIEQAINSGPRTVVVLGDREAGGIDSLIAKAKAKGVKVYVILVGSRTVWSADAKKLCQATGGKFLSFPDLQELARWNDAMPPLD